jgi:hypothetical protein
VSEAIDDLPDERVDALARELRAWQEETGRIVTVPQPRPKEQLAEREAETPQKQERKEEKPNEETKAEPRPRAWLISLVAEVPEGLLPDQIERIELRIGGRPVAVTDAQAEPL